MPKKSDQTEAPKKQEVVISAPNFQIAEFVIEGTTPYVQNKFSSKARELMKAAQEAGPSGKKNTKREPKDFQACYEAAIHRTPDGGYGLPASGLRAGLVSACRVAGFQMTKAKLCVFVVADAFGADDGTPLVKITKGEPKYFESLVRNDSGVADIRPRPKWSEGWQAKVRIRFDADQFTLTDVSNLLMRVGMQVGVGEGRADSKDSVGMGWGEFQIVKGE